MGFQSAIRGLGRGIAAAGSILLALACVIVLGLWGAFRDLDQVRQTIWSAEVSRIRSHAERTVGHIESEIVDKNLSRDLSKLQTDLWLRYHWQRSITRSPDRIYGAITTPDGHVIVHSNRSLENKHLKWPATFSPIPDAAVGVTRLPPSAITLDKPAWDVTVPILIGGTEVGIYHSGFSVDWLESRITDASVDVVRRWLFVIGGILVVVTLASLSLYSITKWNVELRTSLAVSELRRAREMNQVMSGLAHEIRNPLNAIRLNLHALERVFRSDSWIPTDELREMLRESAGEIDRIAGMITEVVDYSKRDPVEASVIDIVVEIQRTLAFVERELEESGVSLRKNFSVSHAVVPIAADRLRQILLNLLRNSTEAAGDGGWIEVGLAKSGSGIELTIEDNGPGVSASDRELVFEPFYSTKSSGMGLGLSMARKYAAAANGTLKCRPGSRGGSKFVLWLPRMDQGTKQEVA